MTLLEADGHQALSRREPRFSADAGSVQEKELKIELVAVSAPVSSELP